jgi:hypothetical protein
MQSHAYLLEDDAQYIKWNLGCEIADAKGCHLIAS